MHHRDISGQLVCLSSDRDIEMLESHTGECIIASVAVVFPYEMARVKTVLEIRKTQILEEVAQIFDLVIRV